MISMQINFYNKISIIISLEINILDVTKFFFLWRFIIVNLCELLKSWLPIFSFCWPSLILTHSTLSTKPFFIETSRALKPVACSYLSHPFTLTFQHGFKDKYFKVFISIVLAQQPNPEECLHIKKAAEEKKQKTPVCWQSSLKSHDYSFQLHTQQYTTVWPIY